MKQETVDSFSEKLKLELGDSYELRWDVDKKGVVFGWLRLSNQDDIYKVAQIVAGFTGRVMTISTLNTPTVLPEMVSNTETKATHSEEKPLNVVINYHFYFDGVNLTTSISLPDDKRSVKSITPVLISADWHEREMHELFNIELQGHPTTKRLFLDESINMNDHTMIPLSEALKGASTSTLWEKIMQSGKKGAKADE